MSLRRRGLRSAAIWLAVCAAVWLVARPAAAAPPTVAVFGFSLLNTSPAASTPEELARLHGLDERLLAALAEPGRYTVLDAAPLQARANIPSIRDCNGCELDIARQAGAAYAAYGWMQKVSNLILNINIVIEDTHTGQVVKGDSVDIRGNTDQTWQRGLRYLIDERLFRD